jgi:hypothetical protein
MSSLFTGTAAPEDNNGLGIGTTFSGQHTGMNTLRTSFGALANSIVNRWGLRVSGFRVQASRVEGLGFEIGPPHRLAHQTGGLRGCMRVCAGQGLLAGPRFAAPGDAGAVSAGGARPALPRLPLLAPPGPQARARRLPSAAFYLTTNPCGFACVMQRLHRQHNDGHGAGQRRAPAGRVGGQPAARGHACVRPGKLAPCPRRARAVCGAFSARLARPIGWPRFQQPLAW